MSCNLTAISLRLQGLVDNSGHSGAGGKEMESSERDKCSDMRFRAKIRPDNTSIAEEELRREIRQVCVTVCITYNVGVCLSL